jgi:hypothetical protein
VKKAAKKQQRKSKTKKAEQRDNTPDPTPSTEMNPPKTADGFQKQEP